MSELEGDARPGPALRRLMLEPLLVIVFTLLTLILGYNGLAAYYHGQPFTRVDLFYMTLQLFVLQHTVDPGKADAALSFARFAAPLLASYAAVRALMAVLAEPLKTRRLAWLHGHVIICGLSRKGLQLLKDFQSQGVQTVVIEWDKENDLIETARAFGALVLLGDASEEVTLRKAGIDRASYAFAVCREDGVNAEIALIAERICGEGGSGDGQQLTMFIHIWSLKMCELLKRRGLLERRTAGFRCRVFNIYENIAREVLRSYPLDWQPIRKDDPRTVHLIIVGMGSIGECIALQAAKIGHFANGKRLQITAIDKSGRERRSQFLARYPFIHKVCDIEFLHGDFEDPDVLAQLERYARDPNRLISVAVCLADDSRNLAAAIYFSDAFKHAQIPVRVRMNRKAGLARLAEEPGGSGRRLEVFIVTEGYCSEREIVGTERDKLAQAAHESYRAMAGANPYPPWDDLAEEIKEFNRQVADHTDVKLRTIGCENVPAGQADPNFAFTPEETEILARMEHSRWCAAQYIAGYQFGKTPDGTRDLERRVHPMLIPWEELPELNRNKDRNNVVRIPEWLRTIGRGIKRKNSE
ncbi:MAG TPA: NAD-binding protein [Planctomycetota bacterium]|nr:NAD-binding protein [Planctomycetota bacterium]